MFWSALCIEKAKDLGASVAATLAEVAEKAKIILMLLPGPKDVRACVSGGKGLLSTASAGTVIVDMSTIDPATTTEMAGLALAKGVGYVDAPVLGRPATVGHWTLPAGGRPEDIDRCRPVLSRFAAHILHVGPSGSGHKIKLLNQMMFGAINAMTAEMMAVASRIGIEPKLLYETITASQAGTGKQPVQGTRGQDRNRELRKSHLHCGSAGQGREAGRANGLRSRGTPAARPQCGINEPDGSGPGVR